MLLSGSRGEGNRTSRHHLRIRHGLCCVLLMLACVGISACSPILLGGVIGGGIAAAVSLRPRQKYPLPARAEGADIGPQQWRTPVRIDWRTHCRLDIFDWGEYDGWRPVGSRLLSEKGVVFAMGGTASFPDQNSRVVAELMLGRVRYDGQTMAGVPVTTDTDYTGLEVEYSYYWKLRVPFWDTFRIAAGGEIIAWSRDIKSRSGVTGYTEEWSILAGVYGVEMTRMVIGVGEFELEVFGMLPVVTIEDVPYFDLTLAPKTEFQLIRDIEARFRWNSGLAAVFAVKWLTFRRSPVVRGFYQPASSMLRVGFGVEYAFTF